MAHVTTIVPLPVTPNDTARPDLALRQPPASLGRRDLVTLRQRIATNEHPRIAQMAWINTPRTWGVLVHRESVTVRKHVRRLRL